MGVDSMTARSDRGMMTLPVQLGSEARANDTIATATAAADTIIRSVIRVVLLAALISSFATTAEIQ